MAFYPPSRKASPFSVAELAAALARHNQRASASNQRRLDRVRSIASLISAMERNGFERLSELLKSDYPVAHSELLSLQNNAKRAPVLPAWWNAAVASFEARNGPALGDVRARFPDLRTRYLPQLLLPPIVHYAKSRPAKSSPPPATSSSAPALSQKSVTFQSPDWNCVAVGDPPFKEFDQNLVDCNPDSGFIHVKTHTRPLFDTFGLTNTAGLGVYVSVDPGYRQVELTVEYDYDGTVLVCSPVGEAWASVDLIYDVMDVGTGDSLDHFEYTIRGVMGFPPSSFGQSSDFSATGNLHTSTLSIDTQRYPNGYSYLVSIQFRCTGQALGGAEGDAFVHSNLRKVTVTMIP